MERTVDSDSHMRIDISNLNSSIEQRSKTRPTPEILYYIRLPAFAIDVSPNDLNLDFLQLLSLRSETIHCPTPCISFGVGPDWGTIISEEAA